MKIHRLTRRLMVFAAIPTILVGSVLFLAPGLAGNAIGNGGDYILALKEAGLISNLPPPNTYPEGTVRRYRNDFVARGMEALFSLLLLENAGNRFKSSSGQKIALRDIDIYEAIDTLAQITNGSRAFRLDPSLRLRGDSVTAVNHNDGSVTLNSEHWNSIGDLLGSETTVSEIKGMIAAHEALSMTKRPIERTGYYPVSVRSVRWERSMWLTHLRRGKVTLHGLVRPRWHPEQESWERYVPRVAPTDDPTYEDFRYAEWRPTFQIRPFPIAGQSNFVLKIGPNQIGSSHDLEDAMGIAEQILEDLERRIDYSSAGPLRRVRLYLHWKIFQGIASQCDTDNDPASPCQGILDPKTSDALYSFHKRFGRSSPLGTEAESLATCSMFGLIHELVESQHDVTLAGASAGAVAALDPCLVR